MYENVYDIIHEVIFRHLVLAFHQTHHQAPKDTVVIHS